MIEDDLHCRFFAVLIFEAGHEIEKHLFQVTLGHRDESSGLHDMTWNRRLQTEPLPKTARSCKRLTRREKTLFEGLARGMTITDAARGAGYSQKWPGQAGHQALENIKQKDPGLFERHGLDDDSFIEKHLKPALNATEVKVARIGDGTKRNPYRFIYSKPLPALGIRMQATRLVAEMKGLIVKEQDTPGAQIRVVVINQANRPPRITNTQPIPQIPGLPAPGNPS